jgi:hypothetical protein
MPAPLALREWSLWSIEKAFVWQQAAWRAWAAAFTGARPSIALAAQVLRPVRTRVKRNAHRGKK